MDIDSGHTYLLRAGLWEHGLKQGPRLLERYSKARPYGPINSSAKKLKPVQLALMLMAQVEGELEGLCSHISVEMGLFINKEGSVVRSGGLFNGIPPSLHAGLPHAGPG